MPLADYLRLEGTFERLGRFGIAVRGRAYSALLFSRRPIRQLDGRRIAITEESSTTVCLLRLLLEQRYQIHPEYLPGGPTEAADAALLIGDAALRLHQSNTRYPYEIDVGFEWWLWQHLPFVFAVWAIRRDADPAIKRQLEREISRSLGVNAKAYDQIAATYAKPLGMTPEALQRYLSSFLYRLSRPEEEAIERFRVLVHEHHLL